LTLLTFAMPERRVARGANGNPPIVHVKVTFALPRDTLRQADMQTMMITITKTTDRTPRSRRLDWRKSERQPDRQRERERERERERGRETKKPRGKMLVDDLVRAPNGIYVA